MKKHIFLFWCSFFGQITGFTIFRPSLFIKLTNRRPKTNPSCTSVAVIYKYFLHLLFASLDSEKPLNNSSGSKITIFNFPYALC